MENGRFGEFGGRYIHETLMNALYELEAAYTQCKYDFIAEEGKCIVVCLSGRGDKDVAAIARYRGENLND